jgi:hypothetical protein
VKPSSADALIGFVQQAPTRKAQASSSSWWKAVVIDEKAVFIDEKAVLIDEKGCFDRWKVRWSTLFSSMKMVFIDEKVDAIALFGDGIAFYWMKKRASMRNPQ